jgi:hypothetical protein
MIWQVIVDGSALADQQDLIASRVCSARWCISAASAADAFFKLGLSEREKTELTEYLKSLQGRKINANQ